LDSRFAIDVSQSRSYRNHPWSMSIFTVAPDEWAEYETCRATPNSTGQPTPAPPLSPGSRQSSGPPLRARTGALPGSRYLAWQIQRPGPIKCYKLDRAPTAADTSPAPPPLIRAFEMRVQISSLVSDSQSRAAQLNSCTAKVIGNETLLSFAR